MIRFCRQIALKQLNLYHNDTNYDKNDMTTHYIDTANAASDKTYIGITGIFGCFDSDISHRLYDQMENIM